MATIFVSKHRKKILYYITAFSIGLFIFQIFHHYKLEKKTLDKGEQFAETSTNQIANALDSFLVHLEDNVHAEAEKLRKWRSFSNWKIKRWCINQSMSQPYLLGVTFSIAPKEDSLYSLFYDRYQEQLMRIDTIYNYSDSSQTNTKWFTEAYNKQKPQWSSPYFGSGAQNLITDYSVPVTLKNGHKIVISYTIAINKITATTHNFSLGRAGYSVIIDKDGTIISHPNPDLIVKHRLQSLVKEEEHVDYILENSKGFKPHYVTRKKVEIAYAFQNLESNDWKLITIFSPTDLFGNDLAQKSSLIRLFLFGSISFCLLIFIFFLPKGLSNKELWLYSVTTTAVLILNISFIWYLNLLPQYSSSNSEDVLVNDKADIKNFVGNYNSTLRKIGFDNLIEIPTGISIEKIRHEDTYNVGLSGWIWQKYPLDSNIEPAIHFPQLSPFAESDFIEKISEEERDGYLFVKWKFRSTFIFAFDYRKFPFNTKNIKLKISYPDYTKNIILTPDVESYYTLTPSELPGISSIAKTNARYISTKFSFSEQELAGDHGSEILAEVRKVPVMQFEIKTRKPFLNALIKQYIPIFLVSLMIFLLLFNLRVDKDSGKMTVGVETVAGFLFILVLSHIDFRKTIFSSTITYLETFYFVLYFLIGFISINIVFFNLGKNYIMTRDNNRFLKLTYWPFFYLTILITTLIIFN